MNYVRSISGSVSKTWNSVNPATLSGAIDVVVVEHPDGTLACSPFHVRFGKFSLLRPYEKKVEFSVNNAKQDYAMKLGEGGEAFFVFETSARVPEEMQTSPLISPATSPPTRPSSSSSARPASVEPEPLDLNSSDRLSPSSPRSDSIPATHKRGAKSESPIGLTLSQSFPDEKSAPLLAETLQPAQSRADRFNASISDRPMSAISNLEPSQTTAAAAAAGANVPPSLSKTGALERAKTLSTKLKTSNIESHANDQGDLMLDMTGYKSSDEDALRTEVIARQILSEELEGNYDIGSLIGADEKGNLWIYGSEESKEAATRRAVFSGATPLSAASADNLSDPGYHSGDDAQSQKSVITEPGRVRAGSDSAVGLSTPPDSPSSSASPAEPQKSYAKTLRLTSEQLQALRLKPGANPMSFSVNRATCTANMYLWKSDVPIVVSDVDGTITKSDVLGHVLNMIGRDWTHIGVAKLYTDIVANGYKVLYLTSRSVGQADTTRTYLKGINQEGYKLPAGPVIMSPDRTLAALRREVYLRKPEVFKMSCLRDIMALFGARTTPFYAGFGNRLTDALSYRSVNIPSTRIFTINSNAEVSLDLLSLNKYRTAYTSMRETVDHFFPPVNTLVLEGGEQFTDFNYWRDAPRDLDDFSMSGSDDEGAASDLDDDDDDDDDAMSDDDLGESYLSRDSLDDGPFSPGLRRSVEQAPPPPPGPRPLERPNRLIESARNVTEEDLDELDLVTVVSRSSQSPSRRHRR